MQTNDNEYFRSAVTDEWNTPRPLTGQEQAEEQKQQTFRTKRHKTAQRAFSLAAPVAVVTVAATLVTVVTPPPVVGILCPVCGEESCHFYDGVFGQFLYEKDLTPAEPEQSAADSGLSYEELSFSGQKAPAAPSHYLKTADGTNAGLTTGNTEQYLEDKGISVSINQNSYSTSVQGEWGQSFYSWGEILFYTVTAEDRYITIETTGEPSDDEQFALVELIYLTQGGEPQEQEDLYLGLNILVQPYAYTYECRKLDQENLWIRAYSYIDGVSASEIVDQAMVFTLPATPQQIHIGSSIVLSSPDTITLTGSRARSSALDNYDWYPSYGMGQEYLFRQVPDYSRYDLTVYEGESYITDISVQFAPYDWNQVQTAWSGLMTEAETKGHEGFMTSVPLQDVTVNGITYHVYLNFTADPETGGYDCSEAYFVPETEPTCQILCPVKEMTAENLSGYQGMSLESLDGEEDSYWRKALSQFYPAGREPLPETTEKEINRIDTTAEFDPFLLDMDLANPGNSIWVNSEEDLGHNSDALEYSNRVSNLVDPGSGLSVVATRKAYDMPDDAGDDAMQAVDGELYCDTQLYTWIDADGTLNWYRDTNGLGTDAYAVIRPEGVSCRYEWTAEGPVSYTVYPSRDTVFDLYDSNPMLSDFQLIYSDYNYDPKQVARTYRQYLSDTFFCTPIQWPDNSVFGMFGNAEPDGQPSGKGEYAVCVDYTVHLLAVLRTDVVGADTTLFGVVDGIPDITPELEAFDGLETVDCTLNVNGEDITLPLYTGIDNHIAVRVDGASIIADSMVKQEGGNSNSIPDDGAFIPDGPVEITVSY